MSPTDVQPALRAHPFFASLTDTELARIAGCGRWAVFSPGQILTREGDAAEHFYAICQGKVAVQTFAPGHGAVTLQTLRGGDVLGWSWCFPPASWTFDACAIEPTQVVQLRASELLSLCEKSAPLGFKLMKGLAGVMTERLRSARLQLLDLYAPPQAHGTVRGRGR